MYKSRRRKTSVRNTHPSKNQRNRSQKATRKQSEAGNNALKGKRGTLIRNESASSSKYFLAESSDKDTPVQYLRPNLHPIYQVLSPCRCRISSCNPDKGVSRRRISSPAAFFTMVSDTCENAFRIRSTVGLSVLFGLFSGCKPGSVA